MIQPTHDLYDPVWTCAECPNLYVRPNDGTLHTCKRCKTTLTIATESMRCAVHVRGGRYCTACGLYRTLILEYPLPCPLCDCPTWIPIGTDDEP